MGGPKSIPLTAPKPINRDQQKISEDTLSLYRLRLANSGMNHLTTAGALKRLFHVDSVFFLFVWSGYRLNRSTDFDGR
jgi:hypothetical protein